MSEQESKSLMGMPKKVSIILIIALIVSGGGVLAFLAIGSSDKAKYFKAEQETMQYFGDTIKDRFQHELDWLELTENNPIESNLDVSAQFKDPGFFGYGAMVDVEEIINNSNISFSGQTDIANEQLTGELSADIAGMEFTDFRFGLTGDVLLIELPFLDDVLKLEDKDTGQFLHMLDPVTFDENTEIDFSKVFDSSQAFFTEEDKQHFSDVYGQLIYQEIPEDAFTSEKESIDIADETLKAEKIQLALSEEQVKQLVKSILEEMKSDEYLKDLMKEQFEMNVLSADETEELMNEFDEGLVEAINEVDEINLPNGLTSTIWIDNNLVVQRSFEMVAVNEFDEEVKTEIFGTQLLDNNVQQIDYDLILEDSYDEYIINFAGDFSRDGENIEDTFTIDFDMFEIVYVADETLTSSDREFTRSIGFDDGWTTGSLIWAGDTTYEADQMQGAHQIYVEADGIGQDLFALHLDVAEKKIKEVDMINDENSLNIGTMSEAELMEYVETDATEQFMGWYFEMFGGMDDLFY